MFIVRPVTISGSIFVSSTVAESEAVWSSGTTYADGAVVRGHTTDTAHLTYESQQAGNTNHNPTTDDGTWWLATGATNRWKMFDGSITSQTQAADEIEVEVMPPGLINTASVQNVSAASVQFVMTDDDEGVVYDQTFSLVSDSGIADPYAYCFEPIERVGELTITDLPPYAGASLTMTLSATGETVKCGALIIGQGRNVGGTQYGATVGILDFSRKERDRFGNYSVAEGAFSKRANFTVMVENTYVDQLQILLASLRATPTLFVGSETYGSTTVFGFFRDFNVEIAYPTKSLCTIELEGLT